MLKLREVQKPKLKLTVGEELMVPVEDDVVEHHHPFEAGKFHHVNPLADWRTNYGRMAEVNRDPEVFPLDHVRHQFVDLVKVVIEVLSEGLNVE